MNLQRNRKVIILIVSVLILSVAGVAGMRQISRARKADKSWGAQFRVQPQEENVQFVLGAGSPPTGIRHWNAISIDASGLDHTPVPPGDPRIFGEQLGPGRSSCAIAIVHIAIFDVVNAIAGGYQSYTGIPRVSATTSMNAAIAQTAHDTLSALFPSQRASFDALAAADLGQIPEGTPKFNGISLGKREAKLILQMRVGDGSAHPEPRVGIGFIPSTDAGKWRQDPISLIPLALGAHWGDVRPFVIRSGSQFRVPPPPAIDSAAYATAFNEVKQLGGDGVITSTTRTPDQTQIGIFWGYDGTPSLCAPPRLYNQILIKIADQMGTGETKLARQLALANTAMAD